MTDQKRVVLLVLMGETEGSGGGRACLGHCNQDGSKWACYIFLLSQERALSKRDQDEMDTYKLHKLCCFALLGHSAASESLLTRKTNCLHSLGIARK